MGRWRPPRPKASPYITADGYAALQKELEQLWLKRRDVVAALSAAAAEGDRSENAEYIYRKKELGAIDYRIRYLQKRLPSLTVVRDHPNTDRVFFGAHVSVVNDDGDTEHYRIVGPDEADSKRRHISLDSPLAQSLLKKTLDDEVTIVVEGKQLSYTVIAIRYQ